MRTALVDQFYNSSEYLEKLRKRAALLKEATSDELHRQRLILDLWSVDPINFIETFLFLKIPNYNNAIKPFFLFDYQKKIIQKLLESEQDVKEHKIVIDKPREMGISWTILAYYYWRWLFTPNWSGFILSRSEAEVDDGSTLPDSSLFGKLRWLIANTPKFMLPEGFAPKGKKGNSTDMALKIVNPALQSSITGSTTNSNAGRSRRYSISFIDEAFFIDHFLEVEQAMNSVSRVQVYVSSSKMGRTFDLFVKEQAERGDHIPLTWRDHPWNDDEWYAQKQKEAERNPEVMREVEVSYALSDASQYYPQTKEAKVQPVEYDVKKPLYMSLDIGRADLTVLVWWQYVDGMFRIVECYSNKNKDIEWYAPFMNPEVKDYNDALYPTDFQKKLLAKVRSWRKPTAYFGELDHFKKVMPTNRSSADLLNKLGIRLMYNQYAVEYEPRRIASAAILPITIFNSESNYVMELFDSLCSSRYANAVTSAQTAKKPVHDVEIADYRSAYENGAVNIPRMLRNQRAESRSEDTRNLTNNLIKYLRI
jgi:hypothetical protein